MKKKIILTLALFLLMILFITVGCDDTERNVKKISLYDFRRQGYWTLPIKAQAAIIAPNSPIWFRSKATLAQLESMIAGDDTLVVQNKGTYLLVQSVSGTPMGYCMIYPQSFDEFNYVICDMSCKIKVNVHTLTVAAPLHLIPSLMRDRKIEEGMAYECTASLDELAEFYRFYGYEVTQLPDRIVLKDTIGKLYSGEYDLGSMVTYCEVLYNDGMVTYVECSGQADGTLARK